MRIEDLNPHDSVDNTESTEGGGWSPDEVTMSQDMKTLGLSVNVNPVSRRGPIEGPCAEQGLIMNTLEFFHQAFARPEFIGWHYCGLIDATLKNPWRTRRQHTGLVGTKGVRYDDLQRRSRPAQTKCTKSPTHG